MGFTLPRAAFTDTVKAMPRISSKNQVTVPVSALAEAGLHAGDRVIVEPVGDGELRVRRAELAFDDAFGALTGTYPAGYLARLDEEERRR
jgi:bifunctional DNA-binding transcriptional regulator/antitoxin component of YhaV-PrlF toxin-antitoxin module